MIGSHIVAVSAYLDHTPAKAFVSIGPLVGFGTVLHPPFVRVVAGGAKDSTRPRFQGQDDPLLTRDAPFAPFVARSSLGE